MPANRVVRVANLARVEGEGALSVTVRDGRVTSAELRLFEPPRFFEALLRGRAFTEAPDITARICGICPVAYQMSAVHALERALGIIVDPAIRALRRLLYCGEWIESHSLHVVMLHAPDFLGYAGGIEMARDHPEVVGRGLTLKKTGNELMTLVGGREIHPINVRVGGFYRVPRRAELAALRDPLERARDLALETVRWTATLDIPEATHPYEFVSLRHPAEYPFNEGRLVSSAGLDVDVDAYDAHFEEIHLPHTTALQSRRRETGGTYLVGPLARYNLNFDRLTPLAQDAARSAGLGPTCTNPYQSIVVRAVEMLYACEEALRIVETYAEPARPYVEVLPRAAVGYAATEAPRGLLVHRYRIADDGTILEARIVPPTSQNQPTIEADLARCVERWLDLPDEALQLRCEQAVRNYDPCISCATHFLDVRVRRESSADGAAASAAATAPLATEAERGETRVIGIGAPEGGDDAVGRIVAARVRDRAPAGVRVFEERGDAEPLLRRFDGADRVVLVDAARSGAPAGSIRRIDVATERLPAGRGPASSHGLGLAEAIELARTLGRLPRRCIVLAVEASTFEPGAECTPAVAAAIDVAVERVLAELEASA